MPEVSEQLPRAILWDLDGTLLDSHDHWSATWSEMADRRGVTWTEAHGMALVGMDLLDAGHYIRDQLGFQDSAAELVKEMVTGVEQLLWTSVPWQPGARELLAEVRAACVPSALVTMSYRSLVEPVLAQLPSDTFDVVVTGDEVSHGKPHPAPYLAAAAALGVDPRDCVAIEDSKTGVASATAAGCAVVVVAAGRLVEAAERRVVVAGLEALGLDAIRELVSTVPVVGDGTRVRGDAPLYSLDGR